MHAKSGIEITNTSADVGNNLCIFTSPKRAVVTLVVVTAAACCIYACSKLSFLPFLLYGTIIIFRDAEKMP